MPEVKKCIFVCGFNNYLGIDEEYDAVNESMYTDGIESVKKVTEKSAITKRAVKIGPFRNNIFFLC